jgi:hypothetical protein
MTSKFSPAVVSNIPLWVEGGLSAEEIAQRVGCTVGGLRVRCSRLKISLRRPHSGQRSTKPEEQGAPSASEGTSAV